MSPFKFTWTISLYVEYSSAILSSRPRVRPSTNTRLKFKCTVDHMGAYGYVWVHIGTYGYIWVHMGTYGYIWVHMGTYR